MLQLIVNDYIVDIVGDGASHKTVRIQAHSGDKIIIQDDKVKHSPLKLKTKKVDDDLYIFEENTQDPSVIIKDYFANNDVNIYAYEANGTLEPYIYAEASDHIEGLLYLSSEPVALSSSGLLGGLLAVGGIGAAVGGGGGGSDATPPMNSTAMTTAYDPATGIVSGTGATPGSTVTATLPDGTTVSGTANPDGTYTLPAFSPAPVNGETITATAGTESATATAPDSTAMTTAYDPATGIVSGTGATPGSTVTATLPDGTTVSGTVNPDGTYTLPAFSPAPVNGETITATAGTESATATAPDNTPLIATITMSDTALKIGDTSTVTITFSEAVISFDNSDVMVENGTVDTFISSDGGITWSATFTPTSDIENTTNTITLVNTYTDTAGNAGTGATSDNYEVDTTAPTATITMSDTALKIGDTSTVTITFSEAVISFDNSDVMVENGTVDTFISSDGGITWSATFTPTSDIENTTNTITLVNTYTDTAGNAGTGATSDNYEVDTIAPSVILADKSSPIKLEATGATTSTDRSPQITAVGTSGEFVVTFQGTEPATWQEGVYVQKFDSSGNPIGAQAKLDGTYPTNNHDSTPQITAVGTSGEYVVTWRGADTNGDYSIFVQKFDSSGVPSGTQATLEATGVTNQNDFNVQITAVGTSGEYVVTYKGLDINGDTSIFVQKFNADGTIQGSQVQLEATGVTNGDDDYPAITAVGTTGEFVVVYHGVDTGGDSSIFVQKFNSDGTIQGSQVQLEATGVTNGADYYPTITAVGTSGEYVVTYSGVDSNGDYSIFVQKFNSDGTIQGSQVMLEATGVTNGNDTNPQVTAVGTSGEYVVTYQGIDTNGDSSIFVQKFDSSGVAIGTQTMLEATSVTDKDDIIPQITAVGTSGEFVVIYQGLDTGSDSSIFVQKFDSSGNPTGTQTMLEYPGIISGNEFEGQITAVGTSGEFVVTYYGDDIEGDYSVFVQKFNADGTPQVGLFAQSDETGMAYLVNDSVVGINDVLDITNSNDNLWNSVDITTANQETAISTLGLVSGTYHLYGVDEAGNLSAISTQAYTIL